MHCRLLAAVFFLFLLAPSFARSADWVEVARAGGDVSMSVDTRSLRSDGRVVKARVRTDVYGRAMNMGGARAQSLVATREFDCATGNYRDLVLRAYEMVGGTGNVLSCLPEPSAPENVNAISPRALDGHAFRFVCTQFRAARSPYPGRGPMQCDPGPDPNVCCRTTSLGTRCEPRARGQGQIDAELAREEAQFHGCPGGR